MPFKNYQADVDLDADPTGGTYIRWAADFEVEHRWTGWFWKLVMQRVLASTASKLAEGAENSSIVCAAEANLAARHVFDR
jgi:hypothetical protein